MPPRPLHNGRPGTSTIPVTWPADHRHAAEGTMVGATCIIRPPDSVGAYDRTLGRETTSPSDPVYTGPCRVVRTNTVGRTAAGGQEAVPITDYLVVVPVSLSAAEVGYSVTFTAATDARLLTTRLTVQSVLVGSLAWERDLYCTAEMSPPAA